MGNIASQYHLLHQNSFNSLEEAVELKISKIGLVAKDLIVAGRRSYRCGINRIITYRDMHQKVSLFWTVLNTNKRYVTCGIPVGTKNMAVEEIARLFFKKVIYGLVHRRTDPYLAYLLLLIKGDFINLY